MKKNYLFVLGLLLPTLGYSAEHPVLLNPTITSCGWGQYYCAAGVRYRSDGTGRQEIRAVSLPNPTGSSELVTIGVHCFFGDKRTGIPFSDCQFDDSKTHAPQATGCRLASLTGWDLDPNSRCETELSWGGHTGAGPGGECVLFIQKGEWSESSALTIYGRLDPTVVANSGNMFCQKPLPPDLGCTVSLPPEIDHGPIAPTARSQVSVTGFVECGSTPNVTIIGGGDVDLAPGLMTKVTAVIDGTSGVILTSDLTANNAAAGEHRGAIVVRVSPY